MSEPVVSVVIPSYNLADIVGEAIDCVLHQTSAAGLDAFEFLGSAESWQDRWRPQRRDDQLTAIYPLRPAAMITALHDVTAHVSRRVQRAVRYQEVVT